MNTAAMNRIPCPKLTDAEGRSSIYVPIREGGEVVDSKGFELVRDDTPLTISPFA